MNRLFALAIAPLFLIVLVGSGCSESREDLAEESVSVMKELVAALEDVKDEASATAAKPKLQSLANQMDDINERMTKLGESSEEETKAMIDKHGKEMEELTLKLTSHMMRIAFDPKIQAVLNDIDMKSLK